jgi:molecular chaperone GrpE
MRSEPEDRRPEDEPSPTENPEEEALEPDETAGDGAEPPEAEDLKAERDRLMDRLMRLQAEFENFRKRMVRERSEWESRAREKIVLDLLPVVDSFDRALTSASGSSDEEGILNGMMLVHKQLLDALKANEVTPIEALGEPFDPNLHEAFMSRPAAGGETPGTIVEEFATGYRMGERVIRATKGIVAGEPESGSGKDSGEK